MKKVLALSLFCFSFSAFSQSWISMGRIDLREIQTSHELASKLSELTVELIEDGEDREGNGFFCSYQSKIGYIHMNDQHLEIRLDFSFHGTPGFCEERGVKELWKELSLVKHVSLGEILNEEKKP